MTILEDDCDGCGGVIAIVCLQLFFSSFENLSFILFFVPKNIYYFHFQAGLDKCIPEVKNSPHITIYFVLFATNYIRAAKIETMRTFEILWYASLF